MKLDRIKVNSNGKINNLGLKIMKSRYSYGWVLVDNEGHGLLFSEQPSFLRKAKLYWFLYLTSEDQSKDWLAEIWRR